MSILIIGGSGFVGLGIVKEAIDRGYDVTTLVLHPDKMNFKNEHLTVKKCDVSCLDSLKEMCKGYDTVISAYNPGWSNPNIYEDTLKNYPTIIKGAKEAGVKRILVVGGAGTLKNKEGKLLMDAGVFPDAIMPGVKALGKFYLETLKKENDIDWVFFCPPEKISPGKRTGCYKTGSDDAIYGEDGECSISIEDYAKAMIDEYEKQEHHKERFTIGY